MRSPVLTFGYPYPNIGRAARRLCSRVRRTVPRCRNRHYRKRPLPRIPLLGETPSIALSNVRITNHEATRSVSLTFRLQVMVKGASPWPDHEVSLDPAPLVNDLRMPINLLPQTSACGNITFDSGFLVYSKSCSNPLRVEVEDHLSGKALTIPGFGRYRTGGSEDRRFSAEPT
jgi:hypothetical protein